MSTLSAVHGRHRAPRGGLPAGWHAVPLVVLAAVTAIVAAEWVVA